jgi:plastocyanin
MPARVLASILLGTAVLATAACGGGSSSGTTTSSGVTTSSGPTTSASTSASGGASSTLALAADPNGALKYDKTSLQAKAGKVSIDFTNTSGVPHDVVVSGNGVMQGTKPTPNGKETLSLNLKPGTYEFYCSVDGHRAAGMKGTLTVK